LPTITTVDRLRAAGCVFAEEEADLLVGAADSPADLERMIAARVAGEPLEHILGWVDFCGNRVAVTAGVFVPRQRTAFLVQQAIALTRPGSVVLDLCCGAGAIGLAVRAAVPEIVLYAADVEPAAVACARVNVGSDFIYEGDLYDPLPTDLRRRIDIITANVPYVPTAEIALMPTEARDHEPRPALDGGADGLEVVRRVAADAPDWLADQGSLLIEIATHQISTAAGIFAAAGLSPHVVADEDLGATVIVGIR
jgi:release factor glutamine methyltransferase